MKKQEKQINEETITEINSFKDNRGQWWIACCECVRGGNGDESCAAGARFKRFAGQGCFCGEILAKYQNAIGENP